MVAVDADNQSERGFVRPDDYARERAASAMPPRGELLMASCRAGERLAEGVLEAYQRLSGTQSAMRPAYLPAIDFAFSDRETCARLDRDVHGADAFLFQSLHNPRREEPIDQHLMALLVAARTLREWGARHVTAVVPYLAYARQDKPTRFQREPTTARLVADLVRSAGIERIVVWHPHSALARGFFGDSLVALEPLGFFLEQYRDLDGRSDAVVVAPDAGAAGMVAHFSRALNVRSAIALKRRPVAGEAQISEVLGDLSGCRTAIVLDDMIASGGTLHALVRLLVERWDVAEVLVGASHNLCLDAAYERLQDLHHRYRLRELVITDSIPQTEAFRALPFVREHTLAEHLARAVNAIHYEQPLTAIFSTGPVVGARDTLQTRQTAAQ